MNWFSVVIPVYNAETFIGDCLDSLIAQDYGNWFAICVNDGSTDRSFEILSEYSARDSRIRVFNQKNAGVSSARNTAIKLIEPHHDNWVSFLDADDFIAPNMFSSLNKMLSEDVAADVNYVKTRCIPVTTRNTPQYKSGGNLSYKIISREDYFREGNVGGLIASIIVRSDFLKDTGIILPADMKVLEDQVFSLRIALKAEKIMVIDFPFYYYYQNSESQGNRNFHVDDIIRCVNYLWSEFADYHNKFIQSYFHNKYLPTKMGMIKKFNKRGCGVSLCTEINATRYLFKYYLRVLVELPGRVINKVVSVLR